jgi:PAS domain S-box-containing protein
MATMFLNAYWAFCMAMISQSPNVIIAEFWQTVLCFWPFLMAVLLHFTFAYTESNLMKSRFFYAALYFPPLFFSLTDLTTNLITATPTLKYWGYANSLASNSVVLLMDNLWACAVGLLVVFLFASYYNRIIDQTKKQQTMFVAMALAIPIVISFITDSVFPVAGIDFPGIGAVACSLTTIFVVYGMLRYQLFSFRPEIAAENIFSTMPDSIILLGLKGEIIKVNRALVELTGYSEEELIGVPFREIMQKATVQNNRNQSPQILDKLRVNRKLDNYEISFYTKSGEKKTGMLSCSMVTDNSGRDVGAAFVLHDLTERLEMESKLLRAERFASIGELAGMLGHDLRNPLSGIRGAAYYLKRKHKSSLDNEDLTMFENIDKCINYSNKIINDLLDYSCEIKLQRIPTTPQALMAEALTLVAQPPNINIKNQTSKDPQLLVDEVKICRCFTNLIKNAFDAMSSGGELTLSSQAVDGAVEFSFKDTGHGMPKETIEKLWTPLFTTKARGMGFGLAICKRNVEAHGGKITVESTLGVGTTVRVELPLSCKN